MTAGALGERVAVVVDGYSTGRYLAPAFIAHGCRCVHVRNATERLPVLESSFAPAWYLGDITYDGDVDAVLASLSHYDVKAVVPGTESGVPCADVLSEALGLPTTNGTRRSAARRDKLLMAEAMRAAQVATPRHLRTSSLVELADWAGREVPYPVVVKPLRSAGTDGVRICRSEQELCLAFSALMRSPNLYGFPNEAVLAQEFVAGTEYMVNSVSHAGDHRLIEVWRSCKRQQFGAPVYDYLELVGGSTDEAQAIRGCVEAALDALEIRFGPAHSEVIMALEGPVLVEVAARLQGSIDPSATLEATGTNIVLQTVAAYLTPDRFLRATERPPAVERCVVGVGLISGREGTLEAELDWDRLRRLPSYHSGHSPFHAGDRIPKTTSVLTSIGSVYLVHAHRDQVVRDYRQIRQWEGGDFYEHVACTGTPCPSIGEEVTSG